MFHDDLKEWNQKPLLNRDWTTFRVHFAKAHSEWKSNLRLTVGQNFPQANAVDTLNPTTNNHSDTVEDLANLLMDTAADGATVATLTDTIAQLLSEVASAQEKLILSLLDNQRLLKRLLEREGSWNTSGVWQTERLTGVVRPDHGMVRASTTATLTETSVPSFKCTEPATGHIKNATRKYTRGVQDQYYKKK